MIPDAELVAAIDAIPSGDPEQAHGELDDLLLANQSEAVLAAVQRMLNRTRWWASA